MLNISVINVQLQNEAFNHKVTYLCLWEVTGVRGKSGELLSRNWQVKHCQRSVVGSWKGRGEHCRPQEVCALACYAGYSLTQRWNWDLEGRLRRG